MRQLTTMNRRLLPFFHQSRAWVPWPMTEEYRVGSRRSPSHGSVGRWPTWRQRPALPRFGTTEPRSPSLMAKHKSKAELDAGIQMARIDSRTTIALQAIKYGGLVGLAFIGVYLPVHDLAGHTTLADFGVRFLANIRVSEAAAWLWAFLATGYGLRQRELLHRNIDRLGNRIPELEKQIDPNRTSSRLTSRGETRPEDEQ